MVMKYLIKTRKITKGLLIFLLFLYIISNKKLVFRNWFLIRYRMGLHVCTCKPLDFRRRFMLRGMIFIDHMNFDIALQKYYRSLGKTTPKLDYNKLFKIHMINKNHTS